MNPPRKSPLAHVSDEVIAAMLDLDNGEDAYFHFPWPELDNVIGGMPYGEVCYITAFSGHGKTTFLMSLTDVLFETTHHRMYYLGLESRPKTLRSTWACHRLGYDAGKILTGEYLKWATKDQVRLELQEELRTQMSGEKFDQVRFSPMRYVTAATLWQEAEAAKAMGCTVFVVDHVDHIEGEGNQSTHAQSIAVNKALLDIAHEYGFLVLVASQLNNEVCRSNRSLLHLPPRPHFVQNGGHKRQIATWMIGLFKPLKQSGLNKADLDVFNETGAGFEKVLEPNTMAAYVMKHRPMGKYEGRQALLGVEQGRVVNLSARDISAATHDIRTDGANHLRLSL